MAIAPEWVNPLRLHDVWEWVRKGLEVTRRRSKSQWLPEDVYAAIKNGQASLFLIEDRGFIVLQEVAGASGKELFVWVIWGQLRDIEAELFAWLRECKRKAGAVRVWWRSPRRWDARKDVRLSEYVFELED